MELVVYVFFFNDTATTEIYTLSLHDALPICHEDNSRRRCASMDSYNYSLDQRNSIDIIIIHVQRSEEHTSELQSLVNLVCRLLLE